MNINNWFEDFPTEEGHYWFYGDPYFGLMGKDYREGAEPDNGMYLVIIRKLGNSLCGQVDGQLLYNRKFDKERHRQGYVGKFLKAILPEPPKD